MEVLIISGGIVVNKLLAASIASVQKYYPSDTLIDQSTTNGADVGWSYANGTFSAPSIQTPMNWRVSVYAFRQRFTQSEQLALYSARSTDGSVQIFIDDISALVNVGVDLSDPITIASINSLAAGGLLTTARAAQILTTPPSQEELQ